MPIKCENRLSTRLCHWATRDAEAGQTEGFVDTFFLTQKGLNILGVNRSFTPSGLLAKFRLHSSPKTSEYGDLVFFEAMLELNVQGWTLSCEKPSKKVESVKPSSTSKTWYFSGAKTYVQYLHALLYSGTLFELGLPELFHFQSSSYYKTLLYLMKHFPARLCRIKPNQPHAFYKILRECGTRSSTVQSSDSTGQNQSQHKLFVLQDDDAGWRIVNGDGDMKRPDFKTSRGWN